MRSHTVKPTCAICTAEITGTIHREPLGRNDAPVVVCDACATESPRALYGPERAYEGAGGTLRPGQVGAALRAKQGDAAYDSETERNSQAARAPGRKRTRAERDLDAVMQEGRRRMRSGAAGKQRSKGRLL